MWFIILNLAIQPDSLEVALCEIFQPTPLGANREFQVQPLTSFCWTTPRLCNLFSIVSLYSPR